ncbi:MAG: lactate utilization protein [Planctomycetes bacterium]|nr:lactate utilization protein [Planctomycetota bacterium]
MASRDRILARLKRAQPAPSLSAGKAGLPALLDASIFGDYPVAAGDLVPLFSRQITALNGECHLARDAAGAADKLEELLQGSGEGPALAHPSPLVDQILARRATWAREIHGAEKLSMDSPAFSRYAIGISAADFLVARTGSIVLRSSTAGGRRLSVLPPFHIVIAESRQVVASLDEALLGIENDGSWSYGAVITGPSRTSDIEKVLVLGAHGPKRLAVILLHPE